MSGDDNLEFDKAQGELAKKAQQAAQGQPIPLGEQATLDDQLLQNAMDKAAKSLGTASNIESKLSDAAGDIAHNLGGDDPLPGQTPSQIVPGGTGDGSSNLSDQLGELLDGQNSGGQSDFADQLGELLDGQNSGGQSDLADQLGELLDGQNSGSESNINPDSMNDLLNQKFDPDSGQTPSQIVPGGTGDGSSNLSDQLGELLDGQNSGSEGNIDPDSMNDLLNQKFAPGSGGQGGVGGVGGAGITAPGAPGTSTEVGSTGNTGSTGGVGGAGITAPGAPGTSTEVGSTGNTGGRLLALGALLLLLIVVGGLVLGSGLIGSLTDGDTSSEGNGSTESGGSNPGVAGEPGQCYESCDPAAPNCAEGLGCVRRADGSHICFNENTCASTSGGQSSSGSGTEQPSGQPALPESGCVCQGTTLVCADGSIGEYNPQCTGGGGATTCNCQGYDLHCTDGSVVACSPECGCKP